ncbi:alpha/beta fold hydrolase [Pseudoalteromonas sp. S16_S37]|uniref:alpha/beta fold hydrolase n=1 Tax=Pseudoalteromonas sp. S16_S37 TaxID=2720228 RepID=UPI001680AD4F|nr:alpha/beta fold hydrolase [Pseudoalteromonas sp. S16_S37]MBD1583783.1 alpha/beta hydrolase [Pseudoalteromonas sp. S16_S37]
MIEQQSLFISLGDEQKLHLRYIAQPNSEGPAVFFMHGAVENGKIFYTESNKGLAPFLASLGYRCYVADLRGRGLSLPEISANSNYGQTEAIMEDIPAMLDYICKHSGGFPRFWVAHSWGGVLMNSYFARFCDAIEKVDACVYFGSKRSLHNRHVSKYLQANLIWYGLAPLYTKKHGFLPAKSLNWGSDNETKKSHQQGMNWAKRKPWIDSDDGFDYAASLKNMTLPPILHIAGVKDKALAQPIDIKKFMQESGRGIQELRVYGRKNGHQHNYGHIDMLTHTEAHKDQFKDLLDWFARFDRFAPH